MPGRVVLIRHGETEWSSLGRYTSVTDIDLTPRGERQAAAVPAVLDALGLRPATVLCSPRTRARRTAELAGLAVSRTVEELAEWHYGSIEGERSDDLRADRPDWSVFTHGAPGGESPAQVAVRADRALELARQSTADGDVALIGHGHLSRVLAARWLGWDVWAGGQLKMDPAAVTVLGRYHGRPSIDHLNVPPPE